MFWRTRFAAYWIRADSGIDVFNLQLSEEDLSGSSDQAMNTDRWERTKQILEDALRLAPDIGSQEA